MKSTKHKGVGKNKHLLNLKELDKQVEMIEQSMTRLRVRINELYWEIFERKNAI